MTTARILICWEDRYYTGLKAVCRSAARAMRQSRGATAGPELFDDTIGGFGGYRSHVEKDWPKMRKHGIPGRSRGPIDHIVYVLDADAAAEFLQGATGPAPAQGETATWYRQASRVFESQLRTSAPVDQDRVHGCLLRWSKETLVLAAHDQDEVLRALTREASIEESRGRLYEDCEPRLDGVPDDAFVDTFRSTKSCMGKVAESFRLGRLKKSDLRIEDLLKKYASTQIDVLMARVPDIRGLAEKLADLGQVDR